MVRTRTKTLRLAWLGLILSFSITNAFAQQSDKPASDTSAKPIAAPPQKPKRVWTNDDIPSRTPAATDATTKGTSGKTATSDKTTTSAAQDGPVAKGALKAQPAKNLMKAWANRSLWIKNPSILGGCDCFDFKNFNDCEIWSFDDSLHMTCKGGKFCQVREFIADKEPGHVPGDYGLIIGGIGDSYTVSFPEPVTESTQTFSMRDATSGWSFEVFDGPCSARAKK